MEKLLLIDGHSILSRAYYGIPLLTTSSGIHTNAVYGFLNIMFKCIEEEHADYIAAAFDLERSKLKRTLLYPEYKGTRKPMPSELLEQVPIIQDVLKAMNVPIVTMEGYEADDILGTLAKRAQNDGLDVTVVSGDRDLLQLCDEHIKLSIPKTSKGRTEVFSYYPQDVLNEYKVTPLQFIDLKALMGDSSDNIPGLPGVGPKTAADIISSYGSIENAKAHEEEISPKRAQSAMKEHYDLAELSKILATIDINAPVEADIRTGRTEDIYTSAALKLMRDLELKSIVAKYNDRVKDGGSGKPEGMLELSGLKEVKDAFLAGIAYKDSAKEDVIGLYVMSDAAEDGSFSNIAAGLALSKDRIYVICSGEGYKAADLKNDLEQLILNRCALGKRIVTMDLKPQLKLFDIPSNGCIYDYKIAQYVLDPNRSAYDYDDLAKDFAGCTAESRQELLGKNDIFEMLGMNSCEQMSLFAAGAEAVQEENSAGHGKGKAASGAKESKGGAEDEVKRAERFIALNAVIPLLSDKKIVKRMKETGTFDLFKDIEMPLVYSLDRMEKAGIRVDRESLSDYADSLKIQIDAITEEIYELAGEQFNINSPSQLGVILFEKLGIKGAKKTKTGYSTSADILEKAAGEHEIVPKVLRYRALTKLYSTYAKGLNDYISKDGRIHGTFNQTIAATGRISSTDPNLQNIPVRTAEGKEIRKVFVPAEGCVFVDADYSQVELRILAALSGDSVLIDAYKNAVDIHTLTASQVFHVDIDKVTPEMRRNAKAVNFGIVYGISAFGLGEGLSISRKEANEYIANYFASYPKVKEYLDNCVAHAREKGYVTTYFGRIRPIPELKSSNFMQRSFGERIAMNSPIQGTAADIMKIAMNRTDEALKGMKSRIVLQVRDELLIETWPDELDAVKRIVRECMENAADLKVKLSVDVRSGDTWYDCH